MAIKRIKSKWADDKRVRSPAEIAGAVGMTVWRVATIHVDEIEEAGFALRDAGQRFAILAEFLIYLVQVADREVYAQYDDQQRAEFITALALHVAGTLADNQQELLGPGEYRAAFIDRLNAEIPDYSDLNYGEDGPGYRFMRYFGEKVLALVGEEKANKWVIDQVMEVEAPAATATLRKNLVALLRGAMPEAAG